MSEPIKVLAVLNRTGTRRIQLYRNVDALCFYMGEAYRSTAQRAVRLPNSLQLYSSQDEFLITYVSVQDL